MLVVKGALRFEIRHEAKIGCSGRVEIKGAIPVDISIQVDAFDVELNLPENAPLA